jgi:hypothetical protein
MIIERHWVHPLAIHELGVIWGVRGVREQVRLRGRRDRDGGGDRERVEVHQGGGRVGGGSFLIALVLANLAWAISTLMSTPCMGSESRLGTIGALGDFMGWK